MTERDTDDVDEFRTARELREKVECPVCGELVSRLLERDEFDGPRCVGCAAAVALGTQDPGPDAGGSA